MMIRKLDMKQVRICAKEGRMHLALAENASGIIDHGLSGLTVFDPGIHRLLKRSATLAWIILGNFDTKGTAWRGRLLKPCAHRFERNCKSRIHPV